MWSIWLIRIRLWISARNHKLVLMMVGTFFRELTSYPTLGKFGTWSSIRVISQEGISASQTIDFWLTALVATSWGQRMVSCGRRWPKCRCVHTPPLFFLLENPLKSTVVNRILPKVPWKRSPAWAEHTIQDDACHVRPYVWNAKSKRDRPMEAVTVTPKMAHGLISTFMTGKKQLKFFMVWKKGHF